MTTPIEELQLEPEQPSLRARFRGWRRTRNYWLLLGGLPGLAGLILLAALAVFLLGWRPAHAETRCYEMAQRAFAGKDFETARIGYQSLLRLGGKQREEYALRLMLSLVQLQREREATHLSLVLAPPRRLGYAPAHLLVARQLLMATNALAENREQAINHLERVLSAQPHHADAHELLSQLYLAAGKLPQAKRHLLELVQTHGDAMLRLAQVLATEGDVNGSRNWAERAGRHFRTRLDQARKDDPALRLALANALVLQDDWRGAQELLQRAWGETRNPDYREALARISADRAAQLARAAPVDTAELFRVVQTGLQFDPGNPQLITQLALLTGRREPEGRQAQELVDQMFAEGRNTAMLHFCLGNEALARGDLAAANRHLKEAYALAPEMPSVANNMALLLSLQHPPELARALAIIEPLVQREPRNPVYRDTRGQILVKLGRHREAIADLAFALPLLPDKRATHACLADCYRSLGLTELAAQHEEAGRMSAAPPGAPAAVLR